MLLSVMRGRRNTGEEGIVPLRLCARRARAFTLIELVMAMGIAFTVLAALAFGYMQAYRISDSALLQAEAQRLACDRLETVLAASWRYYGAQPTNQLTDFVGEYPQSFQVPSVTSSQIVARVVTQIATTDNPPLAEVRVQCIWTSPNGFVYTNEVATLRAPD